jgi:ABC-type oligopeptide transport system substrate-binding subunit
MGATISYTTLCISYVALCDETDNNILLRNDSTYLTTNKLYEYNIEYDMFLDQCFRKALMISPNPHDINNTVLCGIKKNILNFVETTNNSQKHINCKYQMDDLNNNGALFNVVGRIY